MHELSLAQALIALAETQARSHHAAGIEEIELEIGHLAGIEPHTFDFALRTAVRGTLLQHARIVRHYIDGEARCSQCEASFPTRDPIAQCPHCGSWWVTITRGKELRLKSIVIN